MPLEQHVSNFITVATTACSTGATASSSSSSSSTGSSSSTCSNQISDNTSVASHCSRGDDGSGRTMVAN